jgi:hypothetical protein
VMGHIESKRVVAPRPTDRIRVVGL